MLGNAARLPGRDFGRSDRIEQRRLAVVDVTHDGHDRRARLERRRVVGRVEQTFLHVGLRDALDGVAEFLGDELGGIGIDHVGDLEHLALLHQDRDHGARGLGHAVGEFLDGDRLRDGHFAGELFLRLRGDFTLAALNATPEGGVRALALLVHLFGGHHGEAGTPLLLAGATRRLGRGRGPAGAGTARADRGLLLVRLERGGAGRGTGQPRLVVLGRFAETLLGNLVGLFLARVLLAAALLLDALARFGLLALLAFERFTRLADARQLFLD